MPIWGTVVISYFQFKTKSGKKYQKTIYTENLILDFLDVIFCW